VRGLEDGGAPYRRQPAGAWRVLHLVVGEGFPGVLQREALFLQPQGGLGSHEPLLPVESPAPFRRVAQRVEAREKRIEKNARQSQRPEGSLLGYAGRGARNRTGVCHSPVMYGNLAAL
jgi:hypothetical protein